MTDREAMRQALEALEAHADIGIKSDKSITALRERLAQPEQKQRQWRGLARLEFQKAVEGLEDLEDCWIAIEAALREKNGGQA